MYSGIRQDHRFFSRLDRCQSYSCDLRQVSLIDLQHIFHFRHNSLFNIHSTAFDWFDFIMQNDNLIDRNVFAELKPLLASLLLTAR